MLNDLKSTALHILELAVIVGLIYGITRLFPDLLPSELIRDAVVVVLAGLVKFARASEKVPVADYVNPSKK